MAAPKFDKSCQSLRRAEKFGMAAVNAVNMGQPELSGRLMCMMIWSICTSDSGGPDRGRCTADACDKLLLLGAVSHASSQPRRHRHPSRALHEVGRLPRKQPIAPVLSATQDKVAIAQANAQTTPQGK